MKEKYIPLVIGLMLFTFLFIFSLTATNEIEESIKKNRFETVGMVYKFYSNRSNSRYYFKYYFNNKVYYNNDNLKDFEREECVNRFYKINLSTENPKFSKIFLDQEVTDTSVILNAGFSLTDMKN
ncbi:hypothetical protein [Flavobacterium sp.]|uniref:hypothetical protein n=1 Tax=Flavobacterium sp. TaxID=239 RepID=UPI00391CE3DE